MFPPLFVFPNFAMNFPNFIYIYFTSKVIELHKSQIGLNFIDINHLAFENLKTNHTFSYKKKINLLSELNQFSFLSISSKHFIISLYSMCRKSTKSYISYFSPLSPLIF